MRLLALLRYELALRASGPAPYVAFGFFLLAGTLAPFALGTDPAFLRAVAPGYLWLAAVIAVLVGLDGLFRDELMSGRLEVVRLSGLPLWLVVLTTMTAYWLLVCLPLVLAALPVAWLLGAASPGALSLSLLLGTPAIALLSGAIAAIASALNRGTGLTIFLALPFFAPCLIFGARLAAPATGDGLSSGLFLAAFSLQCLAVCPVIGALALRQNME